MALQYPPTRTENIVERIGEHDVRDPFRWLEDEAAPEVAAWVDAQDALARRELTRLPERASIAARLRELFYFDAISAPAHHGGRYFYSRKHVDREKNVVYWKQGRDGEERLLFDPNTWSADGSTGLGGWWPSYDGTRVAYSVKEHNSDETVTRVIDVATGVDLPDTLTGTKYAGASWTPDGGGFYYTYVPPVDPTAPPSGGAAGQGQAPTGGARVTVAERPGFAELRYHAIGGDPAADTTIYPPTYDAQSFLGGGISRDGHWLVVYIQHGWSSTDVFVRDARVADAAWKPLAVGVDANFAVDVWRDMFYVTTNLGAPRYRVFAVDPLLPDGLARAAWREIVPESDATLEHANVVGEHLVLTYLWNAAGAMEVRKLDGTFVRTVELPPLGTSGGIHGNPDEDTGYLSYTSFTEPQVIYETSIASGEVREWARVELPLDTSRFMTEQVFFPSKDGTRISMFLIRLRDAIPDGKTPTVLYGYGGFSVNLTPAFAGSRAVWLERGGIYAIPNLRGGGEYGEDWHRAGMLLNKQNVFDDFIAAAEWLFSSGWTSPAHLAISGGSNGGLLTGAVLTQRPELARAVICAVPLLDMLRYDRFGSGKTWVPEYGSADDPVQREVLWSYSPYRRAIDAGRAAWPAVMFDSADHDDRVDPLHARKLAAALQASQTGDAPILLRIERNAGHGGADMVAAQVERVADQLAFLRFHLSSAITGG